MGSEKEAEERIALNGVPDPPKTTRQLVFEILRENPRMTYGQLSRTLNVSRARIYQIVTSGREGPLPRPDPTPPKVSDEKVLETWHRLRHLTATAAELGISRDTARKALTRAKEPAIRRDLCPTTASLVRAVKAGRRVCDAAAEIGISFFAAKNRLKRAHVALKPDPPPPIEEVYARYQAGASQQEIADYYGVGRMTVGDWLRASGKPLRTAGETRLMMNARRIHMMPNSVREESLLDDPVALAALVPAERHEALLEAEALPPPEEDEENLPPHLRKMLTETEDVG